MTMRIIYAGTPEFAVPALQAVADGAHSVVAVYTQPDRPAGRGRKLQPSPVKAKALELGIPVRQPVSLRATAVQAELQEWQADLMVVAAYGLILPVAVLDMPRLGCINIHASLLPRWRGAAPIQRALLAGDEQTGITLMQMDEGLDTGGMLAQSTLTIATGMTSAAVHDALSSDGAQLLVEHLDDIEHGRLQASPQDESQATYADKLTKQEAEIDWHKPARILCREIHAFNPWPVSHTGLEGKAVKIWQARCSANSAEAPPGTVISHDAEKLSIACGEGQVEILGLQFPGKKRLTAGQLLNARDLTGLVFSDIQR